MDDESLLIKLNFYLSSSSNAEKQQEQQHMTAKQKKFGVQ